ncbi:MAG: RNA polymerase sigma factor [Acidobacteriota bacterium]
MSQEDKGVGPARLSSPTDAPTAPFEMSASEAAIVEALRRGDEETFTRLVDQYHGTLRRIARLYVPSQTAAEDVIQDTWLAVIQGVWAFEGRSSLKTWILRILINQAKTRAVREGRMIPFADFEMNGADPTEVPQRQDLAMPDRRPSPEARLLSDEARLQIRAAIDSLPANQRIVITMRDVEGCSSEEVCNVLSISETNQRVILHRARSRVREMVADYFRED